MKRIIPWLNESTYIEPLSPACKMCSQGSKMVVLITGLCSTKCFYCPLSTRKFGKDSIFANEWELESEKDYEKLILEAEYIDANGAGFTGGDPLINWERTKNYISLLKDTFGSNFHIHLYTTGKKNGEHIKELVSVGLNEIRFHPIPEYWDNMNNNPIIDSINTSLNTDIDVAVEIPVIPGMENEIISLIDWANDKGIRWINLNELEFSETNAKILTNRGFTVKNDISAAVKGSQESANNIISRIQNKDFEIGLHYCSSSFKDGIQLKNRIMRRAKNIVKKYEVISDDGTLLKGIICTLNMSLKKLYKTLKQEYEIDDDYILINNEENRIEIAVWILEKIARDLKKRGVESYMVEEYPTADGLEVERIPLPL